MIGSWIWGLAALAWLGFVGWYENWRGRLRADEIDAQLARLEAQTSLTPERLAGLRDFLERDDGREFFMVNLVALHREPVAAGGDPPRPAAQVLREYTGRFVPALLRRAGHPVFFAPAAGRPVEQWGMEPGPEWTFAGVMRYRSRRDMIELATDPFFDPAHAYKLAAMAATLAFPAAPATLVFGPRAVVPLVLALVAVVAQRVGTAG